MGRIISRTQTVTCTKPCDFKGDLAFTESENWQANCPKCGKPIPMGQRPGYNATHFGNRRFSGSQQLSIEQGWHPKEVPLARAAMGQSADCIRDDGSVTFKDSRSEQRYRKDLSALKAAKGITD